MPLRNVCTPRLPRLSSALFKIWFCVPASSFFFPHRGQHLGSVSISMHALKLILVFPLLSLLLPPLLKLRGASQAFGVESKGYLLCRNAGMGPPILSEESGEGLNNSIDCKVPLASFKRVMQPLGILIQIMVIKTILCCFPKLN